MIFCSFATSHFIIKNLRLIFLKTPPHEFVPALFFCAL